MPIHLPPLSRRRFLTTAGAATAGCLLPGWLRAADAGKSADPDRVALLSDTHIAADPKAVLREVCMFDHLDRVRADVLAQPTLPAALVVNGDLALTSGLAGDYATFAGGLKPVREAGIPVHLTLGNHDDRANFWKGVAPADAGEAVDARHATVVETRRADLILLDSLELVNKTPGLLGEAQLKWLAATLDARKDKPCVIVVHHDPPDPKKEKITGLKDAAALFEVLVPRRQAKALVYGHTHKWVRAQVEGLHLVNLPPVAYVFGPGDPSGWVDCALGDGGAKLTLRTVDPKHPKNGDVADLTWRT